MRVDQLPFIWAGEIKKLKPGEFSRIKNDKKNFYSLVVLKKEEPSLLEPYQAYSIIEDKLTQQKIRKLFFKWVADTLQKAEIKINPKLKKSLKG
jgi:tRNA A22 N-methylase